MYSIRVFSWMILFVFCYVLVSNVVRGQGDNFILGTEHVGAIADGPNAHALSSNIFTVTDFGAIADGVTDNSQAFMDSWKNACATEESVLVVPPGTAYLVKGAEFVGPCNGSTEFQISGTLIASLDPSLDQDYWIMFAHVDGLTVSGNGTFDGNGASTWVQKHVCTFLDTNDSSCSTEHPISIKIMEVTNSTFQGISSINSKKFHLQIHECQNISVQNIKVFAPDNSPNTDGIHIGRSNGVKIENVVIGTGDDCISIGDGSTDIDISGVWCGPGHGISIGSLGKYEHEEDVSGVIVANCSFANTTNGLRIKTWAPSPPSMVYDITFANISITSVKNPIIIDQYYCPHSSCEHEGESSVAIKDVKFINIQGESSTPTAVNIQCSKTTPCQGIEFTGLSLTFNGQPTNASCSNADDTFIGLDQDPSQCFS